MNEAKASTSTRRGGLKRWQWLGLIGASALMVGGLVGMLAEPAAGTDRPAGSAATDGARGFLPTDGPSQLPGDDAEPPAPGPADGPDAAMPAADTAARPWSRGVFQLGFGFAAGFAIAFALRVVFRLAMVFLGLWVLSLVAMQQTGFITVNWDALAGGYDSLAGLLAGQFESLRAFLTGIFPASAAGLTGLGAGFLRR